MQEILEQIIDYLKGIWIKRRYIMIATWLICPIGWYMVAQMPNMYNSQARVYVDTQSLLSPLLRGLTIETNANTQLNLILKTLLTRPNLERIARMADLDILAKSPAQYERIVRNLKNKIKMRKAGRENMYTISVSDINPEKAQKIVQATLTVFIENSLGESRDGNDTAQKFLDDQIKEYENRLLAAENRRTEFIQKYSSILSSSTGGYYRTLNSAKSRLKDTQLTLQEVQGRLDSVNNRLQGDVKTTSKEQETEKNQNNLNISTRYDDRISQSESKIDSLLLRYTEQHPEVLQTQRLLANLKEKRDEELNLYYESLKNTDNSAYLNSSGLDNNPVYSELQIQANQLKSEVASLNVRVNNYQAQVDDLESKIHTVPEIEAESTALDRDYKIVKQKFEQLLKRKESLTMANSVNENTDKMQFRVLDAPIIPKNPTGPKRYFLFGVVVCAGVAVGIGLSLLMSQINPIVTSASQLSRATGIPVFGMVSANENLGLQKWHRKKTLIFMMSNLVLLGILAIFVCYFLFPDLVQVPLKRIF